MVSANVTEHGMESYDDVLALIEIVVWHLLYFKPW